MVAEKTSASSALPPYKVAVGQVVRKVDESTREIKVLQMELDSYLKMYFNKSYVFQSVDASGSSSKGDIVLVKHLKNPPSQDKLYGVEKILFKIDDIVDPVTGKRALDDQKALRDHLQTFESSQNK